MWPFKTKKWQPESKPALAKQVNPTINSRSPCQAIYIQYFQMQTKQVFRIADFDQVRCINK